MGEGGEVKGKEGRSGMGEMKKGGKATFEIQSWMRNNGKVENMIRKGVGQL